MKIDTSSPVMVTGATGFVAGPIVKALLDAGLTVHCPVRDPDNESKIAHLKNCATKGKLKFFKADLLTEGSYFEAMQGCSVVFHTASPFILLAKGQDEVQKKLLDPAIKGTQNVLESVSKTPSVQRVVLTSSCYAMLTDPADCADAPNGVIDEDCWNSTASVDYNPYAYSKKLAEQEAWKIADAQSQYKLVVINPSWVHGPGLKVHPTSESVSFVKLLGDGTMASGCVDIGCFMVDVRDVAQAHVAAAFTPEASGRYLTSAHDTSILKMADAIREKFPDYPIPKSGLHWMLAWLIAPMAGMSRRMVWRGVGHTPNLDNSKSIKDLGMKYRPMETTMQDMFQQLVDGGLFKKDE